MAAQLIRGFHLLLAGLFAGIGVGVMIACGALFQALAGGVAHDAAGPPARSSGDAEGLLLIARVFQFVDPLRGAIALALIASSAALMLRSTRRSGIARIGLAALLTALQGYHALSLKPALDSARTNAAAQSPAGAPADEQEPAAAAMTAFVLQRRAFTLLAVQSLLAACLLVAEPFARMRSTRDIAREWARSARPGVPPSPGERGGRP